MKRSGYQRLTIDVPQEFKVVFDRLCEKNSATAREMFCILVAHYEDECEDKAQMEIPQENEAT